MDRFPPLDPKNVRDHLIAARSRLAALTADVDGASRRLPTEAEWEYAAQGGAGTRAYLRGSTGSDASRTNLESDPLALVAALAAGDTPEGVRQLMGNVSEWVASDFLPFPGFAPDSYEDDSRPWFGTRKVPHGGSFASPRRMLRSTWCNFFTPDRADVFAGFRTCARDA